MALSAAMAQTDEPKLTVTPTGRILLDGALFANDDQDLFKDGVAIPDARMGVKATYGNWSAKIDIGFAYGKVGLKDLLFQYTYDDENFIKLGSFTHQFGLQSSTSSSMKPTMEEPTSNSVFNNPRQIGLMYVHSVPTYLGTISAHAEPNSSVLTPSQMSQQGYGFMTRQVFRPVAREGAVLQVGISGAFATPQYDSDDDTSTKHHTMSLTGTFPVRVDKVTALDAVVDDARNIFKFTPELLLSYGRLALESQYFYARINRLGGEKAYVGQGAYATLRGLLIGENYGYAMADGGLSTPRPGALECVLSYNYTNLTDTGTGIYGGRLNDVSCTFNYYINKYMIARFRYAYTHRWAMADAPTIDLSSFQARLQILF